MENYDYRLLLAARVMARTIARVMGVAVADSDMGNFFATSDMSKFFCNKRHGNFFATSDMS